MKGIKQINKEFESIPKNAGQVLVKIYYEEE